MTTFTTEDLYEYMNAYRLADYLDNNVEAMLYTEQPYLDKAATTLRKQADELDRVIPELVKANGIIENLRIRIADLEAQIYGGTTK